MCSAVVCPAVDCVMASRSQAQNISSIKLSEICCIFVLYHPKYDVIEVVKSLCECGYRVVLTSNGADSDVLAAILRIPNVELIENEQNLGLATGLNQAIAKAFTDPAVRFVALFDQDSKPDTSLPSALARQISDESIACIGPQLIDLKSGKASYKSHNQGAGVLSVTSIPTSGTVISRASCQLIGPMMDPLFIDGIDHEWCLRARSLGLKIKVSDTVTMVHDMGDAALNWFGQYKPLYRNPIRHYFIIRNSIYLGLHAKFPWHWRVLEILKTLRRIPVYLLASSDKRRTFKLIYMAVIDGCYGRLGPLVE